MKNRQEKLGMSILIVLIVISIFLVFNSEYLIPKGYELAIDGYVISRSIMIIFSLYLLSKLGFLLLTKEK